MSTDRKEAPARKRLRLMPRAMTGQDIVDFICSSRITSSPTLSRVHFPAMASSVFRPVSVNAMAALTPSLSSLYFFTPQIAETDVGGRFQALEFAGLITTSVEAGIAEEQGKEHISL